MIQEEKELVIKDLCARLLYGVICQMEDELIINDSTFYDRTLSERHIELFRKHKGFYIKPYLRPLSSMTEEEREELKKLMNCDSVTDYSLEYTVGGQVDYDDFLVYYEESSKLIDWLNKKMFDYRDLIPKGLALEAKESMYEKRD